ncbi:MAG: hypothetical protein WCO31_04280 [Actinomycetes bacterium]
MSTGRNEGFLDRNPANSPSTANLALVRRGYDPDQVRRLIGDLDRELRELRSREVELRRQLGEAKSASPLSSSSAASKAALGDEDLVARVGAHSAALVRRAHDEAAALVATAEAQAAQIVASAHERVAIFAADIEERATSKVAEAELEAKAVLEEAQIAAEKAREVAHANGEMLVNSARDQGRGIVAEAREIRRKVLADMGEKRKGIHLQIEQMRAARDEIQRAVNDLQQSVHEVLGNLAGSDDAARRAAQEVIRRSPVPPPLDEEEVVERSERSFEEAQVASTPSSPGESSKAATQSTDAPSEAVSSVPIQPEAEDGQPSVDELFAKIRESVRSDAASNEKPELKQAAVFPSGAPELAAARRDELLASVTGNLARKVKRVLQDDQGQVLVQLRKAKGVWSESLLEPEELHNHRYANAFADALAEAARCGADFAAEHGSKGQPPSAQEIAGLADALARSLTADIRRRLTAENDADAADVVQAAYRPWRGARVEEFVSDGVVGAFGAGVASASSGSSLTWLIAVEGCEGCATNAKSGPVAAGANFPSGHAYGPVHPGCRCLVIPAT